MTAVKNFFAKQSIGFYVGAVGTILVFVGTIMLATNGNMEYYNDYNPVIPLLGMLSVIAACALLAGRQFLRVKHLEAVWLAVVVLGAAALLVALSMRVESMAIILGSDLEKDNVLAQSALSNFIAGMVVTIVGLVITVAASFFKITKE